MKRAQAKHNSVCHSNTDKECKWHGEKMKWYNLYAAKLPNGENRAQIGFQRRKYLQFLITNQTQNNDIIVLWIWIILISQYLDTCV